ncbi:MAG: BamA/TamA family outer membrane protein, partial [Nitrospinota bacterium]
ATSPNKGDDFGVLPVVLFFDKHGEIQNILAPSAIFNTETGLKGAFRWLGYLPNDAKYRIIAVQSIEVDSDFFADIEAPRVGRNGRWAVAGGVRFERDPTEVFYGFGPDSRSEDIAGFTRRDLRVFLNLGMNFLEYMRITYSERVRHTLIEGGGRALDTFIGDNFPGAPGVKTWTTISARGLSLLFDNRDSGATPTQGVFAVFGVEVSQTALGSELSFTRYYGEAKAYIPWPSKQWISAVRISGNFVDNANLPHFEQSILGGKDFRGFPSDRFIDRGVFKINLEERVRVIRLEALRVPFDIEAAPFVEVGQVFNEAGDIASRQLQVSYGLGFRAVVRPNVVGKIDVGAADEGLNIRVGLDYPF